MSFRCVFRRCAIARTTLPCSPRTSCRSMAGLPTAPSIPHARRKATWNLTAYVAQQTSRIPRRGGSHRMIEDRMFPVLENLLTLTSKRQQILAGNVANIDTPGYRAKDISFAAELDGKL